MESVYNFKIKSPPIIKTICLILLAVLGLFTVVITVFHFAGILNDFWNEAAPFYIIPILGTALTWFALYVYNKEEFSLQNGEYKYVKVFKKTQSARVEDISYVKITRRGLIKVEFFDKSEKVVISFYDDGTSFGYNNVFLNSLFAFNIPVKQVLYGEK